ncbi:MAG: phosphatidylglycerol lysyltransferase domain-containing protein, partial [Arcanobacterium sp.]|nr:phosphatidylglycerol lysyltransferase domain-containing protein [Arcanobacterium sp.]
DEPLLSPAAWLMPTVWVASGQMGARNRWRLRTVALTITITMLLYSGSVVDLGRAAALAAAMIATMPGRRGRALSEMIPVISQREIRSLVAIVVVAISAGPTLAAATPGSHAPLSSVAVFAWPADDFTARIYGIPAAIYNQAPLVIMVVIALALIKGRRAAWWCALIAMLGYVVSFVTEMIVFTRYVSIIDLLIPMLVTVLPWIGAIAVLVLLREHFAACSSRLAMRHALGWISVTIAGGFALWMASALIFSDRFDPAITPWLAASTYPQRLLPPVLMWVQAEDVYAIDDLAWNLLNVPGMLVWLIAAFILYRALQATPRAEHSADRIATCLSMRDMLSRGSGDHLAWMTTWQGNRVWIDPAGRGYVAYRMYKSSVVTVGMPVVNKIPASGLGVPGDAEQSSQASIAADVRTIQDQLAAAFDFYAASEGWVVAWYCVPKDFALKHGKAVQVAEEAVVYTEQLPFRGKKYQDIRTARNHAQREGITAQWVSWDDAGVLIRAQISALSEEWIAQKSLPEMGFTLGGIDELKDPAVKLMIAVDEQGRVHGVTSWLPVFENGQQSGWMLDFMRRDNRGFRPVIEFLIAATLEQAAEQGLEWISLSGAPLVRAKERYSQGAQLGAMDSALDTLSGVMEPLYGFRSLAAFKSKFSPRDVPWYMSYPDYGAIPAIGRSLMQAYVPDMSVVAVTKAGKILVDSMRSAGE